ncbi:lipid-A-disaccharide synthase [Thermosulfurimonas sp. F29]|uniref:lipid-A-disaccharide synthase n=1 Tax=Thermosulfurimonas sp. F29 TaxID=2867247 RepID=UPI001C83895F|nr:lipid-A-disaccharide synthase [Thermosulfurimonas sp. F29]MBX6423931.1 lipid-A-disaccharide synthase [Thermosulfurimonas sp. F29]
MKASSSKVLIVAGEESGDLYGAELLRRVREIQPGFTFYGIGGRRMRAAGLECLYPAEPLAVVGLPGLSELRLLREAWHRLAKFLREGCPRAAVLIDFPGFNLRLAKLCRKLGIPVFYYIAPQVWAWHRSRLRILRKTVDLLAVVLPFEKEFFEQEGIRAVFVGHPLVDLVRPALSRETFFEIAGLNPHHPLLGIFPGSRRSEVERLLPVFAKTYEILKRDHPRLQAVVVKAPGLPKTLLWEDLERRIKVLEGYQHEVLQHAEAALLASGTITLEAALLETPMVAAYRLPALAYLLARILVKVPYITLPNLILGEGVVPEFIQGGVQPEALAGALRPYLFETHIRKETRRKLARVKELLGGKGASWRVAELLVDFLRSISPPEPLPSSASATH